jgi:uroporphyrinogen III methyltransferase/synthase
MHVNLQKKIILTRPKEQCSEWVPILNDLGYNVVHYPCIQLDSLELKKSTLKSLPNYKTWTDVIFTSQAGVKFFAEQQLKHNLKIAWNNLTVRAVGASTQKLIQKKFHLEEIWVPNVATSEGILADLSKNLKGRTFIIPGPLNRRPLLEQQLKARGAICYFLTVYKNQKPSKMEPLKNISAPILFTSSSTVKNYCEINKVNPNRPVICLGPITKNTAQQLGFKNILTCENPSIEGIVRILKQNFS